MFNFFADASKKKDGQSTRQEKPCVRLLCSRPINVWQFNVRGITGCPRADVVLHLPPEIEPCDLESWLSCPVHRSNQGPRNYIHFQSTCTVSLKLQWLQSLAAIDHCRFIDVHNAGLLLLLASSARSSPREGLCCEKVFVVQRPISRTSRATPRGPPHQTARTW